MKRTNVDRVPAVPEERVRLVRILHEDPDLAHRLDADEVLVATRQTVGILERVGVLQAIAQMTRVDDRVLMLLWHLSERWGRVRRDGILLPLRLPHKAIARLIGARRPSVTTAIGALERRGDLERRADGAWL